MNLYVFGSTSDTDIRLVSYTVNMVGNTDTGFNGTYASQSSWSGATVPNEGANTKVVVEITGASFQFLPGHSYVIDLESARRNTFPIAVRT